MAAPLLILAMLLLILAAGKYELHSTMPLAFFLTYKGLPPPSSQQQQPFSSPWPSPAPPLSKETQILELLRINGSAACHHVHTHRALTVDLPENCSESKLLRLHIGHPFSFRLVSVSENGTQRCTGGDFYETQLAGTHWMSRPPVVDMGDGTYSVTIFVDEYFPGMYEFKAVLLFDNMHGLDFDPRKWGLRKEVLYLQVEMMGLPAIPHMPYDMPYWSAKPESVLTRETGQMEIARLASGLQHRNICGDAGGGDGTGRWTRMWYNHSCEADKEGRYNGCLNEKHAGKVSLLESNGWIYSRSTCSFMIWDKKQAWQCLQGRWLLFWGDSNLQDSISNLLFFILGFPKRPRMGRILHKLYTNPLNSSQSLLISLLFNGHYDESKNGRGLASLYNASYCLRLRRLYLSGCNNSFGPDAVIITSGLHDAEHFRTVRDFSAAVDFAADFWRRLIYEGADAEKTNASKGRLSPTVVLRTAVAPAGGARTKDKQANPHKMEVFNAIMVEKFSRELGRQGVVVHVLDAYDATFPFHFDHNHSDGLHYGREPKSQLSPWFGRPHHYFVDNMLNHMLLNCLCSHFPPRKAEFLNNNMATESSNSPSSLT
ncbi:hypothetical protein L7F22_000333 [Adiantum nelumboides]|nr:hypothetical protein [Adiantum nelumboides]